MGSGSAVRLGPLLFKGYGDMCNELADVPDFDPTDLDDIECIPDVEIEGEDAEGEFDVDDLTDEEKGEHTTHALKIIEGNNA